MPNIELTVADRSEVFSVRSFRVAEALNTPFTVSLSARAAIDDADLDELVGLDATFALDLGAHRGGMLAWRGVLTHAELVHAEPAGLSTYAMTIAPALWLLGQRTHCRVFRHLSAPMIVATLLREWDIEVELRVDEGAHPIFDYRVQYDESDHAFVARTLEEAGITYFTRTIDGHARVVLTDRPTEAEADGEPIPFRADASTAGEALFATGLHRSANVRPEAFRARDYDFQRPAYDLHADGAPRAALAPRAARLERYEFLPGSAIAVDPASISGGRAAGAADASVLQAVARRRLEAARGDRRTLSFETNALRLQPGAITSIADHPRSDLGDDTRLLVTSTHLSGGATSEWRMVVHAAYAADPYRPPLVTRRPTITGVQSATVVGPRSAPEAVATAPGQEVHVDEHGRVRLLFPWDQEGARGQGSSCWVRVSQLWATAGAGAVFTPRVGDEVLVSFLDGDPDMPVIVGRLYNATHLHPFRLPQERSRTGIRSRTTTGGEGFNELSFEDRPGYEAIRITAQKDLIETVNRDHHAAIAQNRSERVGGDASLRVEGTRAESIGANAVLAIEGARTEVVQGARSSVEGSSSLHVRGDRGLQIDGSERRVVAGTVTEEIRGRREVRAADASVDSVFGARAERTGGGLTSEVHGAAFYVFGDAVNVTAASGSTLVAGRGADVTRARADAEGVLTIDAPAVTVTARTALTLSVGASRIVIEDDKITLDAETIVVAAKKSASILTDDASTGWGANIVSKASVIKMASSDGASLELSSAAKLHGPEIKLGASASADKEKLDRRKEELPAAKRTKVTLRDRSGAVIPGASYEVAMPGFVDRGVSSSGTVEVPVFEDVRSCVLRWGRPVASREPGAPADVYEFQSRIELRTNVEGDPAERARRKLQNLGFGHGSVAEAKAAFARRRGHPDTSGASIDAAIDAEHG